MDEVKIQLDLTLSQLRTLTKGLGYYNSMLKWGAQVGDSSAGALQDVLNIELIFKQIDVETDKIDPRVLRGEA